MQLTSACIGPIQYSRSFRRHLNPNMVKMKSHDLMDLNRLGEVNFHGVETVISWNSRKDLFPPDLDNFEFAETIVKIFGTSVPTGIC